MNAYNACRTPTVTVLDEPRPEPSDGMSESHARHTASRKLLDRLMAMWKTGSAYRPDLA